MNDTEHNLALLDELEEDRMVDNAMLVSLMTIVFLVVVMTAIARVNWSVPALTQGYEATAANIGMVWHQLNAAGLPNELRMIAENSTGAFERMLIGLTT